MSDMSLLLLSLLLSIDPNAIAAGDGSAGLNVPPTVEIRQRQEVRIPRAAKTRSWASAPVVVTPEDIRRRAALREASPQAPVKLARKGSIRGVHPPEVLELMKLQALFLPPSDRIQVFGRDQAGGADRTLKSLSSTVNVDAISGTNSNSVPPDPEVAVGPDHVIAVVNRNFQIYSATDGRSLTSVAALSDLLGAATDCSGLFDPNVFYDEEAGRFLLGADANGSDYCLAVTESSSALGNWTVVSFATDIGGDFFDFPHVGIGQQAFYVGSNQFASNGSGGLSFSEARLFAVDKNALYNQGAATVVSWSLAGFGTSATTPQPLKLHGFADGGWPTSGPDYFVTAPGGTNRLNLWTVDDPFGAGTLVQNSAINIGNVTGVSVGSPVDAPQTSAYDELDAGDIRILDFEYRNGFGWTVQNVSCNPGSGTVNCVRWSQLDLASNSVVDAGVFSPADDLYILHPDLAVNRCNDVLVGFSVTGPSTDPYIMVAGRASDDPAGNLTLLEVMQAPVAPYVAFDGEPLRWGDYTGATVAPDGLGLWYLGEFTFDNLNVSKNWNTRLARWEFPDADSDDVPDSCDVCAGFDDEADSDADGVPNGCDLCQGSDDNDDVDGDGVPDGCDLCDGDDASGDSDSDGVCDDRDVCAGSDDDADADSDGVPDGCDACPGFDDDEDADSDGVPDGCDLCAGSDDTEDADSDGVPDGCDICAGFDDASDADSDGVPDGCDICSLGDDNEDTDGDNIPDACDPCAGDDNVDADGDGVCDSEDLCAGDDATGDEDGDEVCADLDCNDDDENQVTNDRCGVCAGDGTSCLVLYPIADEFSVASTTASNQALPSVAAGEDGFLVSWDSADADGTGIRARRFLPDGTPEGDDFAVNQLTDEDQERPATAGLPGGGYVVAWQSEETSTGFPGIVGRLVEDGAPTGDDLLMSGDGDDIVFIQEFPALATTADGFQLVWQAFDFEPDEDDGVVARGYLADGTAKGDPTVLTDQRDQERPDVAGLPTGSVVVWQDDSTGTRLQALDASGAAFGADSSADADGIRNQAVAADAAGSGLVVWEGAGLTDIAIFARPMSPTGAVTGSAVQVTPENAADKEAPDVAALEDGGFLVVYEEESDRTVRAQLYESDGSAALPGISGSLVEADPFSVSQDGGQAESPAVAGDGHGTFFVVWEDSTIDGSGTGIAGRLFGTDADNDALPGALDNCPLIANADQADADSDEVGDVCDTCAGFDDRLDADGDETADDCDTCTDTDTDGFGDPGFSANTCQTDNCPDDANADQADADTDGDGDVCDTCTDTDTDGFGDPGFDANTCQTDNCPDDSNADQADADSDGAGDVCDTCTDTDTDGFGDPGFGANTCQTDNCPADSNADQADADTDGAGDVCDTCTDTDTDGFGDPGFDANTCQTDNCPDDSNADQADADADDEGDACDTCTDTDMDGFGDPGFAANTCPTDNCPDEDNPDQADADTDGAGDLCDTCTDTDTDGFGDPGFLSNTCLTDNCPDDTNVDQADADSDGAGDVCDTCTDTDTDGFGDPGFDANTCQTDNCPTDSNADQADADSDGDGDVCDTCTDTDGDGFGDPGFSANTCAADNCPATGNVDQLDTDSDGAGDVCDTCTDTDSDGFGDPGFDANTCQTDNCPADANADQADGDGDGVGDACDLCLGDDATGDGDGDGLCADRDCDDGDGTNACAIFSDDFESGDLSRWTSVVNS